MMHHIDKERNLRGCNKFQYGMMEKLYRSTVNPRRSHAVTMCKVMNHNLYS